MVYFNISVYPIAPEKNNKTTITQKNVLFRSVTKTAEIELPLAIDKILILKEMINCRSKLMENNYVISINVILK